MRSIAFLRKTWKKLVARDDEQVSSGQCEPQKSASPSSMGISQPEPSHSPSSHSPSPNRDDHLVLHRNTSRVALDTTCRDQGSPTAGQPPHSSINATDYSQELIPSSTLFPKDVENSVPYQESSPVYRVVQPLDVSNDLGSAPHRLSDRYPYSSTHHACSTDTISSTTSSNEVQYHQKTFHAILDLLVDTKPRIAFHRTRSMPHLPYEDEIQSTQAPSVSSVYAGEGNFPLSLFPTPPPLIARKKIPPPLELRYLRPTASPHSSRDSTPISTPMTPRFLSPRSLSQSSFGSCKTSHLGRRLASISPPPFSPPNSPLPSTPVYHEDNGRPLDYAGPPLRTTYSSNNLKDALPSPATHRVTFSEPISDQSSLPIKKSRIPRSEMQPGRLQACLEVGEQVSLTAVGDNVQWGYAF